MTIKKAILDGIVTSRKKYHDIDDLDAFVINSIGVYATDIPTLPGVRARISELTTSGHLTRLSYNCYTKGPNI